MGWGTAGVCMLCQVEKLESGVVQRPKQTHGKMSGGLSPQREEGGWAQVSEADDNNDYSQGRGLLMPTQHTRAGRIALGRSSPQQARLS